MVPGERVAFAVGTGRCGTYMAYELLRHDPAVAASHERSVMAECFHRYCAWYGLPVDEQAFIRTKADEIQADLQGHRFSFEASAPLSFSVPTLHRAFGARFVLFVRNPVDVINSYLSKGWFREDIHWGDHDLAPGYHPQHQYPHHSFGRLMPKGADYQVWSQLGGVGKLAWTWAVVNRTVAEAFGRLPSAQSMTVRLEDFDFEAYRRLVDFLGYETCLDKSRFEAITGSRPNSRKNKPAVSQWSAQDVDEFLGQIGTAAADFGYDIDLSAAGKGKGVGASTSSQPGNRSSAGVYHQVRRSLGVAVKSFRREWQRPQG